MSSGIEPTPIKLGDQDQLQTNMDLLIQEAFRQGWLSGRHWPNHPVPQSLLTSIQQVSPDEIILKIEWP